MGDPTPPQPQLDDGMGAQPQFGDHCEKGRCAQQAATPCGEGGIVPRLFNIECERRTRPQTPSICVM